MLYPEPGLHAEVGAFLDRERLGLERLEATGCGKIDNDVGPAFDFETE